MKTRKRLCYAATLLALFCLASCAQNDSDDTLLPAGKYPMTFTTSVNELVATRATTDNTWEGGEQIVLQVDDQVRLYKISDSGTPATLTSENPFYWASSNETKTVSGWYYGNGYSTFLLKSWEVESDQSDEDNINYQRSDFLYAPAQDISFKDLNKSLVFYHQTARVVINILNNEATTDVSQITNVTFGNENNLALAGEYTAPNENKGETFGTWKIGSNALGTITPKEITPPSSSYLKSYTALLIPQNMQNKKFIAITLDNRTYYYTPEKENDANFESGKEYTYDVTVKHDHLEAVLVSESNTWGENEAPIDVKSTAPGFSAYDLKIGDYYYSDGSTSDGGYRKYADGTTEILDIKPVNTFADGKPHHVIGIVYSTDVSRIGQAARDYLKTVKGVEPHGLVMALTEASGICRWGNWINENEDGSTGEPFVAYTNRLNMIYKNVDGYSETQWIIQNHSTVLKNEYSAFYYAKLYGTADSETSQYAAPYNTTGWFIPSIGQWWDILSNLGGVNLNAYQEDSMGSRIEIPQAGQTAVNNLNKYLKKAGSTKLFKTETFYWSSSECSDTGANRVDFSSDNSLQLYSTDKKVKYDFVRCSLAF